MNALTRWFARIEHDGAATALEQPATGLPTNLLEPGVEAANDRRRRSFEPTRKAMVDTVGKKVLHGWLQNRHQTLLPLTVNFRVLSPDQSAMLVSLMAAALLASSDADRRELEAALAFLKSSGAGPATLEAFASALDHPIPIYRLFDQIRQAHDLGPLAYILLVVVNDPHDPSNAIFLQWAAAKLELPTTVVRSVERRYRR